MCLARWALLRQARLPEHIAFSEIISAATSKHRTIWRGCCSLPWRGTLQVLHCPPAGSALYPPSYHRAAVIWDPYEGAL